MLTLIVILVNTIFTYQGLQDYSFLDKYSFKVNQILGNKDYKRMLTSGFLHVDWSHFFFNMVTLYFFSGGVEASAGALSFLIIYLGSLFGGNILSLYIHRNNPYYSAVGASGAVSGLVFAAIALFPGIEIGFFLLPFYIPGWLYGIGYVAYSIYGIKSQRDNIGHEAHLGGGLMGLILTVVLYPYVLSINPLPIAAILIFSLVFLYLVIRKPF